MNLANVSPSARRWQALASTVTSLHLSLVGALVSFALGIGQLLSPNTLFGEPGTNLAYDQGVYFGAALRLTNGVLP